MADPDNPDPAAPHTRPLPPKPTIPRLSYENHIVNTESNIRLSCNVYTNPNINQTDIFISLLCMHFNGGTKELYEPTIRSLFQSNLPIDCVYAYDHRVYGDSSILNTHYHDAWGDGISAGTDFSTTIGVDGHAVAKWIRSQWTHDGKLRLLICVGHSFGGMAAVLAQRIEPSIFDSMVLIEPILLKNGVPQNSYIIKASLKRKAVFDSREEAAINFNRLPMYQRFTPEAFWLYVNEALQEVTDPSTGRKTYHLKCSPKHEGAAFMGRGKDIFERLHEIHIPVRLIFGNLSMIGNSQIEVNGKLMRKDAAIATQLKTLVEHVRLPGVEHLVPQQVPDVTAELIGKSIEELIAQEQKIPAKF